MLTIIKFVNLVEKLVLSILILLIKEHVLALFKDVMFALVPIIVKFVDLDFG